MAQAQRGRGGETKPVGSDTNGGNGSRSSTANLTAFPLSASMRDSSPCVSSIGRAPPLKISAEVRKDNARLKLADGGGSGGNSRVSSAAGAPVRGLLPPMDHVQNPSAGGGQVGSTANAVDIPNTISTIPATAAATSASTTTTTTATTYPASPTPTLPAQKPAPPNLVLHAWAEPTPSPRGE